MVSMIGSFQKNGLILFASCWHERILGTDYEVMAVPSHPYASAHFCSVWFVNDSVRLSTKHKFS